MNYSEIDFLDYFYILSAFIDLYSSEIAVEGATNSTGNVLFELVN